MVGFTGQNAADQGLVLGRRGGIAATIARDRRNDCRQPRMCLVKVDLDVEPLRHDAAQSRFCLAMPGARPPDRMDHRLVAGIAADVARRHVAGLLKLAPFVADGGLGQAIMQVQFVLHLAGFGVAAMSAAGDGDRRRSQQIAELGQCRGGLPVALDRECEPLRDINFSRAILVCKHCDRRAEYDRPRKACRSPRIIFSRVDQKLEAAGERCRSDAERFCAAVLVKRAQRDPPLTPSVSEQRLDECLDLAAVGLEHDNYSARIGIRYLSQKGIWSFNSSRAVSFGFRSSLRLIERLRNFPFWPSLIQPLSQCSTPPIVIVPV